MMDTNQAAATLDQLQHLRRRTRRELHSFWFPLLVFGAAFIGSAPVFWWAAGPLVGLYWTLAGISAGVATGAYYRRRASVSGIEGPVAPYAAAGIAIMVGCFVSVAVGKAVGSEWLVVMGPSIVVALGYAAFAWLDRSVTLALLGAGLAAGAVALGWTQLALHEQGAVLAACFGALLVVTGIVFRRLEHRP